MKGINISEEQIDRAKKLYSFGELKGSKTKGKGNLFGAIGEIVVFDIYNAKGSKLDFNSTYDYDLIIDNYKIDVKTKKFTSRFTPNNNWNLNIFDFNTTQKCNYYFFVGVADDLKTAYLYGYIKPVDFYNISTFNKKNEIDPKGNGVWTFKDDCYNLQIGKLNKFN